MKIARSLLDQIVAHAQQDAPDECCGLVGTTAGAATSVHVMENTVRSPLRFEMDGMSVYRAIEEIEDGGGELGAVYHSHTRSAPRPSQTDINFARNWPGIEWIIVGLENGEPEVRSWTIDGATVQEVELEVE